MSHRILSPLQPGHRACEHKLHHGGFAMMDVLISILLFSLGVLALVALQGAMTREQTESKIRSEASGLASEMIGHLWSDPLNLASYGGSGCSANETCKLWQEKVAANLPQGDSSINVTMDSSGKAGDVDITVSWTLPNGETHKYVTATTVTRN